MLNELEKNRKTAAPPKTVLLMVIGLTLFGLLFAGLAYGFATPKGRFSENKNMLTISMLRQIASAQVLAPVKEEMPAPSPEETTGLQVPAAEDIQSAPAEESEQNRVEPVEEKIDPELYNSTLLELSMYTWLPYYWPENESRYVVYKIKNNTIPFEKIVTYVNLNLDQPYYSNITEVNDPASITAMVNKYRRLPVNYAPTDLERVGNTEYFLRREAKTCFEKMSEDTKQLGLSLTILSSYRSYADQKYNYDTKVKLRGRADVDKTNARPGHSEHQTGLTLDIVGLDIGVANTPEYAWYKEHAHEYGFIIRYPLEYEYVTGYSYEPWHLRYLGVELATAVYESGLTFDEYYIEYMIPRQGPVGA